VKYVIENSTGDHNFANVEKLYKSFPDFVVPAFGCHPVYLEDSTENWEKSLVEYIERYPNAMIGEAGLDFAMPNFNEPKQIVFLKGQ